MITEAVDEQQGETNDEPVESNSTPAATTPAPIEVDRILEESHESDDTKNDGAELLDNSDEAKTIDQSQEDATTPEILSPQDVHVNESNNLNVGSGSPSSLLVEGEVHTSGENEEPNEVTVSEVPTEPVLETTEGVTGESNTMEQNERDLAIHVSDQDTNTNNQDQEISDMVITGCCSNASGTSNVSQYTYITTESVSTCQHKNSSTQVMPLVSDDFFTLK